MGERRLLRLCGRGRRILVGRSPLPHVSEPFGGRGGETRKRGRRRRRRSKRRSRSSRRRRRRSRRRKEKREKP